jgi:hypothetical protein
MELSELSVEELHQLRSDYAHKEKIHSNTQHVLKVLLNSTYGCFSSKYFHYFDLESASAITSTGQLVVLHMCNKLEEILQKNFPFSGKYVVAADTDSTYLSLDNIVDTIMVDHDFDTILESLTKFCDEYLSQYLDVEFEKLMNRQNVLDRTYKAGREVIGSPGIFVKKKKYAIRVYNNEGVKLTKPKMKAMGLELIKSSTPEVCRNWLSTSVDLIMDNNIDELKKFVKEKRKKFKTLTIEELTSPRSINELNKWIMPDITAFGGKRTILKSGCPIHVRAAISFNTLLGNEDTLNQITEGDKITFCYLKEMNPYNAYDSKTHVMGFSGGIPKAFDSKYIDYDKQFQKNFLQPLLIITSALDWNISNQDQPKFT